jgi:membrane protease YdiL (CAAX protease family)
LVTESARPLRDDTNATLAPRWHTAALVSLLLAVAATGVVLQHHANAGAPLGPPPSAPLGRIFTQYLPLLVVNSGLVGYCVRVFRDGDALPELLGERWRTWRRFVTDLAFSLGCFFVIMSLDLVASRLLPVGRNAAIAQLLPSTEAERLSWVVVAVSVGFCEEVVYRGYLQTQLAAFTGSRALGVVLQALLFGIAHLEQGPASALRIAVYGLVLGALASARGSLLPGIVCHIGIDLAGGLLR